MTLKKHRYIKKKKKSKKLMSHISVKKVKIRKKNIKKGGTYSFLSVLCMSLGYNINSKNMHEFIYEKINDKDITSLEHMLQILDIKIKKNEYTLKTSRKRLFHILFNAIYKIYGNDPKKDKKDITIEFEMFQKKSLFPEISDAVPYNLIMSKMVQTESIRQSNNDFKYNYLSLIGFVKELIVGETNPTNLGYNVEMYRNWMDIKDLNNMDIKNVDDMWLPYHVFRKFYVDTYLYIATIHAVMTQMTNTRSCNPISLSFQYGVNKPDVQIDVPAVYKCDMVASELKEVKTVNMIFSAVGSVNKDSDYDISILQSGTSELYCTAYIYRYFTLFIQSTFNERVGDEVFDTNLYTINHFVTDMTIVKLYPEYFKSIKVYDEMRYIYNIAHQYVVSENILNILVKLYEIHMTINKSTIFRLSLASIANEYIKDKYKKLCMNANIENNKITICFAKSNPDNQIKYHTTASSKRRKSSMSASSLSSSRSSVNSGVSNLSSINSRKSSMSASSLSSSRSSVNSGVSNLSIINSINISNFGNTNVDNITEYIRASSKELFYSYEAYYAMATIVHVVAILQAREFDIDQLDNDFIRNMSVISALENLFDMYKFYMMYYDTKSHDQLFYKISKYIARIYNAIYLYNQSINNSKDMDHRVKSGYKYIMSLKRKSTLIMPPEKWGILNNIEIDKDQIMRVKKSYNINMALTDIFNQISKMTIKGGLIINNKVISDVSELVNVDANI